MKRRLLKYANKLIPAVHFTMAGEDRAIYLTFDDGPNPETTPRILELLARHDAKATFFCLGRNVEKYPTVYNSILAGSHATGNHSFSHLNGWTTGTRKYLADVDRASELINSKLFRPPYGRLTPAQYLQLKKKYIIIMWTRQLPDYWPGFDAERINLSGISGGDILVLHDSVLSAGKTISLLGKLLEQRKENIFSKLSSTKIN